MSLRLSARVWGPLCALLLTFFAVLPTHAESLLAERTRIAVGETVTLKIPDAIGLIKPKWRASPDGIVEFTGRSRTEAQVRGLKAGRVQVSATVDWKLTSTTYSVDLEVGTGQASASAGQDDAEAVRLTGLLRAMGFADTDARIARLLYEVTEGIRGADSFYAELAKIPAKMTDVVRVRTRLVDMPDSALARQVMGPLYPEGGTLVEQRILTWRKQQTLAAIDDVLAKFSGRVPAEGARLIVSHVGKWADEQSRSLKFPGDIDFSFVSTDAALVDELKAAYLVEIARRTKLDQTALDSVATAHGKAGLEVYIGRHGMAYAELEMKINYVVDLEKGTRRPVGLQEATQILATDRSMLTSKGIEITQPQWDSEPGLSMEMVRHFDHDIVKPGIYDMATAVVKAAKYMDRSYKAQEKSGGKPADPKLAKFASDITALAKTQPQTPDVRNRMVERIAEFFGTQPRVEFDAKTETLRLQLDPARLAEFNQKATEAMWKTVEMGSKRRTDELDSRLRELLERQRKGENVDEDVAKLREDMKNLVDMVEAEIKAIHGGMEIPVSVHTNNVKVRGMLDTLSKRFGTKALSPEELKDKKFVEELLKAQLESPSQTRAEMLKAYIMDRAARAAELSMKGVEKTNQILDFMDDRLLGSLRGDAEFADFEAEMKNIRQTSADPKGKQEAASRLAALKGKAANVVKTANMKINGALQATAAGRQGMKFMAVYGLIDEMQAYRDSYNEQGWEGLVTEFARRRIPFGSAVENVVMGNTYLAAWDVITTLVPPIGLYSAAKGLALSVSDTAQSMYWSEQLALFVDTLYEGAKFELQTVETHGGAKIGTYRLVSVSHPRYGRNIDLSAFAKQRQEQIKALHEQLKTPRYKGGGIDYTAYRESFRGVTSWIDVDNLLRKNLAATDPVLMLLDEMAKHESVGPRLLQYFDEQRLVRWEEVKLGFITNLIVQLEARKQADQALGSGQLPDMMAELRKTAAELEIEDAVLRGLEADVGTNNLKALVNWLWDTKRSLLGQAPKESETLRATQVTKKYLDAYKAILQTRNEVSAGLPAAAVRDAGSRYLTGGLFLSGRAEADLKAAESWAKHVGAARASSAEALLDIKREFLSRASLDAEDEKFLERVFPRELWMKPWKDAGTLTGQLWQLDRAIAHGKERNAILDEYRSWLEKQAPVELTVTLLDAIDGKREINNAKGDLRPTDELGKPGVGRASGNQLLFAVPSGRYRLTVRVDGYAEASQDLLLGRALEAKPKLTLTLMPADRKGDGDLQEFITTALKARDWKRLADRLDAEKKSPRRLQNPTAWQAGIDALDKALATLREERMQWALEAKEYLQALDEVDARVWDKIHRDVEKQRQLVEERCHQSSSSSEPFEKRKTRCQNEGRQFESNCLGTWPDRHWQERTAIRVAKQEVPEAVHTLHSAAYFGHRAWFEAAEKMTDKYKLPFPYPKPVVPRLNYASVSCANVVLPGTKPGEGLALLKVTIATPKSSIPFGKPVALNASASGGKPPYTYIWSTGAQGERAQVTPTWAGEWSVTVTATDAEGRTGEGRGTLLVSPGKVKLRGLQRQVFYGSRATLSLPGKEPPPPAADPCAGRKATNPYDECLRIDVKDLKSVPIASPGVVPSAPVVAPDAGPAQMPPTRPGAQRVVWQAEPALLFAPPTSDNGRTEVTYSRMGQVKVWCEVLELIEGSYRTVGECEQETVQVVAPKFSIAFTPPEGQGRIGAEIRLRIASEPAVADELIDFRWFDPATSNRMELTPNAREIAFKVKDAKPVLLKALARVPHHGDTIADLAATYTGLQFQVKAWAEEPGTRPMTWDPVKGGLKPVPKGQYVTHERIPLRAELQGGNAPAGLRWSWTVNDGTTISNPISQTPTVSRSSPGGIEATVEARDAEGSVLGSGSLSLSVVEVRDGPPAPVNPSVVLNADRASVERGGRVNLNAGVSGGKPPYTYTWQGASGQGERASFGAAQIGIANVTVTVTDSKGGKATASVAIEVTENAADRQRRDAVRLGEQARERLRQNDLAGAIRLARDARSLDADAAAPAAREVAAAARKAGWQGVYDRDFSQVVSHLEAAVALDPLDADGRSKLEQVRGFARVWPQVEAKAGEFDAQMAQKKYFSAHRTLLAMQELQRDMPGASEQALPRRVQRDFDAGMAEYNRYMRQIEETHTRAAKNGDWALVLQNAEAALQREHSPANEISLRNNAELARTKLREQAQTPAKPATLPVSLDGVGGRKGTPRTVKGVVIDDGSWIRFKSTDEKRLALDIPLPAPVQAAAVAIVSNLDDATYLEQGKTIARILVGKDSGDETLDIQAGVHSSEWNYGVGPKHKRVDSADIGDNRFLVVLPLSRPGLVRSLRIEYVETHAPKWAGHAPGFVLRGLSLVADAKGLNLTSASPTAPQAGGSASVTGKWRTSEGEMTLFQNGRAVTGRYTKDGGELVGELNGNVLEGWWIENGSAERCATAKNGRHHWGRMRFTFSGDRFGGSWSYCDKPVPDRINWTGERIGAAGTRPAVSSAPAAGYLRLEACVDGSDWIRIDNGRLTHEHRAFQQIGTHPSCPASHQVAGGGFLVDGQVVSLKQLPWLVGLAGIGRIEVERGRGAVHMDGPNRILIDDDGPGGPSVYVIRLYPSGLMGGTVESAPGGRDYTAPTQTTLAPGEFVHPQVDGVALDICREWGANCGKPAADAFCQSQGYSHSLSHREQHDTPPTRVIGSGQVCDQSFCDRIVWIQCAGTTLTASALPRIAEFSWQGMDEDRVGEWGHGKPNGVRDGRFRLVLEAPGRFGITSLSVWSANEKGEKAGGQIWHSRNTGNWMLGVFRDGHQLNPSHVPSLGEFSGRVLLDLYANNSGWFNPGQWFLLEVEGGDGKVLRQTLRLGEALPGGRDYTYQERSLAPAPPPATKPASGGDGQSLEEAARQLKDAVKELKNLFKW